jgi:hypothetical protein
MDFVWAADAGAPTSLGFAAGKNKIINGDFNVNQRNFSSTTSGDFLFDRFGATISGGTVTSTAQTFTPGTAPVSGYEARNYLRMVTSGQSAAGDYAILRQYIEDVRTFAGQTVTLSFWAQAGSGTPSVAADIFQYFGTGGSPSSTVFVSGQKTAITTSWARYSFTFTIPAISGKTVGTNPDHYLGVRLFVSAGSTYNSNTNSLGIQNGTFNLWGFQLEAGSTVTAFQTATGTLQGELAACQRYFQVIAVSQAWGTWYSTTDAALMAGLPVAMRVTPTATFSTVYTNAIVEVGVTDRTPTSYSAYKTSNQAYSFLANGMTTSATVRNGAIYIGPNHLLSAEL